MAEKSGLEEEIEVLEAIYIHELEVFRNDENAVTRIILQLHPSTVDDVNQQFVCMTLILDLSMKYPDELPEITIKNPRGIGEEELQSLREDMHVLCEERKGGPVLYELIELAKESLTSGNIPHCPCMICLEHFHEGERFTKTQCYHYFHLTCLARYVNHVHAQEPEIHAIHVKKENKKLLCPVCREEVSYEADSLPQSPIEDKIFFTPSADMLATQTKMAAMLEKQRACGGIIDVEAEKNKYLVKEDDVVIFAVACKDVEEKEDKSQSGLSKGDNSNSSRGNNSAYKRRERRDHRGKDDRFERNIDRPHSGYARAKGRGSRFDHHAHSDSDIKKKPFNDRKVDENRRWTGRDGDEYRNQANKTNKSDKPKDARVDVPNKQIVKCDIKKENVMDSSTKEGLADNITKEKDEVPDSDKKPVLDKTEKQEIAESHEQVRDQKEETSTFRKGFGRPKNYEDRQDRYSSENNRPRFGPRHRRNDDTNQRNYDGRFRTSPRNNDKRVSPRDEKSKNTSEECKNKETSNSVISDSLGKDSAKGIVVEGVTVCDGENKSVSTNHEAESKTIKNEIKSDNNSRKGFGRPTQYSDRRDRNRQRSGLGNGRNYDRTGPSDTDDRGNAMGKEENDNTVRVEKFGTGHGRNNYRNRNSPRDTDDRGSAIGKEENYNTERVDKSETDYGRNYYSNRNGPRVTDDRDGRTDTTDNRKRDYDDKKRSTGNNNYRNRKAEYDDPMFIKEKRGNDERVEDNRRKNREYRIQQHKETNKDQELKVEIRNATNPEKSVEGEDGKHERRTSGRGRGRGRQRIQHNNSEEMDWRKPGSQLDPKQAAGQNEKRDKVDKTNDVKPLANNLDRMTIHNMEIPRENKTSTCDNQKVSVNGLSHNSDVSDYKVSDLKRAPPGFKQTHPPGFKLTHPPGFKRESSKPPPGFEEPL